VFLSNAPFPLYICKRRTLTAACYFKSSMKDYKKYFFIPAPPEDVYLALTTESTIQLWTGDAAQMIPEPGTEFSLWDGSIAGRNLEFEKGRKIVQEWYFGNQEEPSIVTIKLHPDKNGTSAELRHTNIPDDEYNAITEGWDDTYFGSLIDFYED
jgi:activator of HSP90 ATPase